MSALAPATRTVLALLEADVAGDWTLAGLAALVHLSPSQLNRVFVADTGRTPLVRLHELRAERMAELLRTTSLSVRAAGARVGWTDPGNATKRFHRHWGMLPTAYRRIVGGIQFQR
ncbi:helix-turn-helix domain-containing protein [Leifsonia sp. NPDC058194]|uniref:helix-turn-helix domain-containing protein n=1 Tax=Leifsonia sp. NPDC058194 TaxID=3346374 RepID=UPI0036DAD359